MIAEPKEWIISAYYFYSNLNITNLSNLNNKINVVCCVGSVEIQIEI